jgi:hypothetical protein
LPIARCERFAGRRRQAALRVIGELQERGCKAAGYRLTGDQLERVPKLDLNTTRRCSREEPIV